MTATQARLFAGLVLCHVAVWGQENTPEECDSMVDAMRDEYQAKCLTPLDACTPSPEGLRAFVSPEPPALRFADTRVPFVCASPPPRADTGRATRTGNARGVLRGRGRGCLLVLAGLYLEYGHGKLRDVAAGAVARAVRPRPPPMPAEPAERLLAHLPVPDLRRLQRGRLPVVPIRVQHHH